MEYNYLGRSGLRVSNICLGTMTFGNQQIGKLDKDASHKVLDRFAALGGNFIDTADVYSKGVSESIIGEWLVRQKRENFVIATKVRGDMGEDVNNVGLGRKHIMKSCDASLKRLQTDYIDLYQVHVWDNATPPEEWLRALNDLVTSGKVRYIGLSNLCGWQLQKVVDLCKSGNYPSIISLQQQYSLLCRHPEFEELQVCKNEGLGVLPWSPLKGGMLTGKYKRGVRPPMAAGRIGLVAQDESKALQCAPAWSQYDENDSFWKLLEAMEKIAKEHGKTIPQVAIRWLLQKDVVPSVIIGANSIEQLEDNVGAANNWKLSKEEMDELDTLSKPETPYPYEMVYRSNINRKNSFYPYPFVENKF
ncbi:1-deoxyxylulose-5-phosphate synthase YajO-like [Saccostrea echinata]|uniref:1-deoxyxylulose-5-phosphate synthase YajO-like n=1 Tax=Saccostrea echinata TaxID=191078 RepID=UPI002A834B2F|nr:1-deoxyxylulose-5-phosphate synthase YajO-like [Saccostrea echinata]XP_061192945.1 1-deoxyxylulose-5-phosphate synthase YajO-like [Saccostrea echinata]